MAELVVQDLVKDFGAVRAVDQVSFTVRDGEFLTLLGPSGCGKSTTLAAIAGLDRPDAGRIALGGRAFFDGSAGLFVPPEGRDVGLVFQSYALWPHMTVRENLEFPLKLRKLPSAERRRRIAEVLDLVEMGPFAQRYPHALSGGQQQRVALARTLVYRPSLLLLDEPLSNLDAKLRERARIWLRHVQSRVGVTTVYVTHDQSEALALSDRIAVMNRGRIVQLDEPRRIYGAPADAFVADFIGSSNFFEGTVVDRQEGAVRVAIGGGRMLLAQSALPHAAGTGVTVAVRPERIRIVDAAGEGAEPSPNIFPIEVEESSFLGARHMLAARLGGVPFRIECDVGPDAATAYIHIPVEACTVFRATPQA